MDETENALREMMLVLLALGPAASADRAVVRKSIVALLQNPPDGEPLDAAWRQIRAIVETLSAPAKLSATATATAEQAVERERESWAMFVRGDHIDAGRAFPGDDSSIVAALRASDLKGEAAAKQLLANAGASGPLDVWRAVEQAALAPADRSDPGNVRSKWDVRAEKLMELTPPQSGQGWVADMTEARRRLHLGEALGRGFGIPFADIDCELDVARELFDEKLKDPYGAALTEVVRGRAHAWRGEMLEATEALSTALITFVNLGNLFRQSDTAYELGIAYRDLHRFEAARSIQARNIDLEIRRGQADALTRALQSCAMTHVNEARLSPMTTEAERQAREKLLAKARMLAAYAFGKTATRSERAPEDASALDYDEKTNARLMDIRPIADSFRATMCARDLSEIALLEGRTDVAQAWLQRAKLEASAETRPGVTMVDAFVMPAFVALGVVEPEQARKRLATATSFEKIRLAELELRLPSMTQRAPIARAEDLDLVARAWDLQKLPTYAIEAWLNAADLLEEKPGTVREGGLTREQAAAAHWRHRALQRAETIGAATHNRRVVKSPVPLSKVEAAAAEAAGVAIVQLMDASNGSRLFRARGYEAIGSARLLVCSKAPAGWNSSAGPDQATMRQLIEKVSRERACLPRIDRSGEVQGAAWILDELVEGPRLTDAIREGTDMHRALLMLAELGDAVQALLSTGIPSVRLDINEIRLAPGDKLVISRYGDLFLDADRTAKSKATRSRDLTTYIDIAARWLGRPCARLIDDIRRYQAKGDYADQRAAISVVAARFRAEAERSAR